MSKIHQFVITNPQMCIACNACVKACIKNAYVRGKLSKKRLDVLSLESGKMPNQCRQCDDAPCANVCPTGALRIANSCVELCEEICIGCKLCTIACPYGAIVIDAEFPPSIQSEVETHLEAGCISGLKSIAIKCDMCKGLESGPACVSVCPTGALVFVDPITAECKFGKKVKGDLAPFLKAILPDVTFSNIPEPVLKKPKETPSSPQTTTEES
ncbi:4Fe-4S dicluster domain-containing protein [Sulfurospirillum deleyianum]|uniref:4Fe-4S ferredoxin iron-sulfur binding domain protein n=1 Tax=Sulfurospirillum deleyianum (strain ATCC 51133 / DSM 6946 / 5175) TaxID=525898 RepID=D1B456_SULD5|nr:4Fe-4S dicluster domain-containing protein [Sulfurospirillum deleyianum]ACZ12876.1 4Fe-4S ferredoxin iron-sulfur binding domain protein [Sulfurospirillum deleyianum DSM 6946]